MYCVAFARSHIFCVFLAKKGRNELWGDPPWGGGLRYKILEVIYKILE